MTTKEKTFELVSFLNYYLPVISSRIPTHINSGGCGYFAKELHLKLKEMGYETKILFMTDNSEKPSIENLLANNVIKGNHGFKHCVVAINDSINFDSDGITKSIVLASKALSDKYFYGELGLEELDTVLANTGSWNNVFDVDCVEQIKKELSKLDIAFERYKKEGFFELPKNGLKLTPKTVKALKAQNPFSDFGRLMGLMH